MTRRPAKAGRSKTPRAGNRRRAGAAMLEYILVCALLVLVGAAATPIAVRILGASFRMLLAVIGSPHPALY